MSNILRRLFRNHRCVLCLPSIHGTGRKQCTYALRPTSSVISRRRDHMGP